MILVIKKTAACECSEKTYAGKNNTAIEMQWVSIGSPSIIVQVGQSGESYKRKQQSPVIILPQTPGVSTYLLRFYDHKTHRRTFYISHWSSAYQGHMYELRSRCKIQPNYILSIVRKHFILDHLFYI